MKAFVFAGTTEGREVAIFLAERGINTTAFTATDYGLEVLCISARGLDNIHVESGRLDEEQIKSLLIECNDKKIVIDATHPYATQVTKNIKKACMDTKTKYIRVLRKSTFTDSTGVSTEGVNIFKDAQEVVQWANFEENISKKILLTTGSKDLGIYTEIKNYSKRVYPRILSDLDSLANAVNLGYRKSNIICMQGPFSTEMNMALIEATGANILVTKDTGAPGGFDTKIEAAARKGIEVAVSGRPLDENGNTSDPEGLSTQELKTYIDENILGRKFPHFPMFVSLAGKKVTVIGGGKIAARRISVLLQYGAVIKVVSPNVCDEIRDLVKKEQLVENSDKTDKANKASLEIIEREYKARDIEASFMVIAATDKREINKRIGKDAKMVGAEVSVADNRSECSFYFPAVIRNESISMGLVSDGIDHFAVSKTASEIREYFNSNKVKRV